MAIIDGDDLASYPGLSADENTLDELAEGASNFVLGAWVNPVDPAPAWVMEIAKAVAARAYWNPKGLTMLSRQLDDAKRTEQFAESSTGQVGYWLTSEERALLSAGASTASTSGVGSIRTRPRGWCAS